MARGSYGLHSKRKHALNAERQLPLHQGNGENDVEPYLQCVIL